MLEIQLIAGVAGTLLGLALAALAWFRNWRLARHSVSHVPSDALTVIIPAHNEETVISETVCAVARAVPTGTQIIVVDDGSTDRTGQILSHLASHINGLQILRHDVAGGKPAALNTALSHARGDVILFLDADTRIDQHAIMWYMSYLATHDAAAVCADMAPYNRERTPGVIVQEIYYAVARLFILSGVYGMPAINGYGLFIKRTVLQRVGPFDARTLVDDFDLGIRLANAGERVLFVRGPRCKIQYAPSLRSFFRQQHRWIVGGLQEVFSEIRAGRRRYLLTTTLLGLLIFSPPILLVVGLSTDRWRFFVAVATTIWAGFSAAAATAYLFERPRLKEAAMNLPLCLLFLPALQVVLLVGLVSAGCGYRRWYKVPREAG